MALGPDRDVPIAGREPRLSGNTLNRAWSPEKDSDSPAFGLVFHQTTGLACTMIFIHALPSIVRAFATCYGLGLPLRVLVSPMPVCNSGLASFDRR